MNDNKTIKKLRFQNNKIAKSFGTITAVCAIITSVVAILQGSLREFIRTSNDVLLTDIASGILKYSFPFLIPISIISGIGVALLKVINVEEIVKIFNNQNSRINKLTEEKENFIYEIKNLTSQQAVILSGLSALEFILNNPKNFQDEKIALERIINPLVLVRDQVLGFSNGGLYNFVFYKYDPIKDILDPVYRDCDKRIEIHNRSWAPGEGHVGLSFQKDEPLIHTDVSSLKTIRAPKEKFINTDNDYYNSFLSAPIIGNAKKTKDRLGVFVITSSNKNQFDNSHKYIASCYTILINLYYTELDKLMESEENAKANE